jgi:hypothetical protein
VGEKERFKLKELKTFKLKELKTFKLKELKTFKLKEWKTFKLKELKTFKLKELKRVQTRISNISSLNGILSVQHVSKCLALTKILEKQKERRGKTSQRKSVDDRHDMTCNGMSEEGGR